ncbi:Branched-chain amino acid transport system permease protein OS=Castellaniella defragrans OX=75697 GN=HNR28_003411 PE=4 SV=1 [Castellaniella defragrans]
MRAPHVTRLGAWAVALLAAIFLPTFLANDYQLRLIVVVGVYTLLTMGLNFMLGYAGLLSLAQVGFFAIGAYFTAILTVDHHWSFWLALLAGMAACAVTATILGRPVLKLKSHYFMFATFVIAEMCQQIATNWDPVTHGATGIASIPRPTIFGVALASNAEFYYLVLCAVVLGVYVSFRVERSKLGRALMAIRESEVAARTMGIKVAGMKQMAFTLSAIFGGLAGGLYASFTSVISPDVFSFDVTIIVLVSLLLGGCGSIAGSIIGTLIVYMMPEWLRSIGQYYMIVYGAGIVLLMVFLPKGLIGIVDTLRIRRSARSAPQDNGRPA